MEPNEQKEVNYFEYCWKCKHVLVLADVEPCFECLANPINLNSHKPVKFEDK